MGYVDGVAGRLEQLYLNTQAQRVCVRDEVDSRYSFIIITYAFWLKLCGYRRTTVLGDINVQYGWGCAWTFVVVHAELCCTTSSMVGWVWAVAESKLLLVSAVTSSQQQLLWMLEVVFVS